MFGSASTQAGRFVRLACVVVVMLALGAVGASAGGAWELRVCADPDNLPYSNRAGEGFENAILEILADEVGAELTYAWLPLPRREGQDELMVRMGACDVLASVPDGREPFLTTLPYYRTIAVFVTREDAPFEVSSLDDPLLRDLRIGVLAGSPEDYALVKRGMIESVRHFYASDGDAAILEAVADDILDLGIVWGPVAGYQAQRLGAPLALTPVSPELDMPFIPMFQALTFAMRSDDVALADLLNAALERRWDDVQNVLASFGVPLLPLDRPSPVAEVAHADALRIGVVLPTLTGRDPVFPMGDELVGEPALRGVILAAERLDVDPARPVQLLIATAPTTEAAERAARRLVVADGAEVLVGGLGEGQGEVLGSVAEELGLEFFDIGTRRGAECRPSTTHVVPSEEMYLEGMASILASDGVDGWFVVYTDSPVGEERYRVLSSALSRLAPGGREAGSLAVPAGLPLYLPTFDAIAASGADAVVLLLEADAQLVFLGQYETAGVDAVVYGYPTEIAQTRQFFAALAHDAPVTGAGPRVAMWDASLEDDDGLNERFLGRWGYPMDPSAWAGYSAVRLTVEAGEGAQSEQMYQVRMVPTAASLGEFAEVLGVFDVGVDTCVP